MSKKNKHRKVKINKKKTFRNMRSNRNIVDLGGDFKTIKIKKIIITVFEKQKSIQSPNKSI